MQTADELQMFSSAEMKSEKLELKFKQMLVKDIYVLKKALNKIFKISSEALPDAKDQKKFLKNYCHYDKNLKKLVMKFQRKKKLEENGVVDQTVWNEVMKAACIACEKSSPERFSHKKQKLKSQSSNDVMKPQF